MSTVLLVEDKLDNQLVIEDIFEFDDIGAELRIVGSAEEALRELAETNPILILMDIGLPGMSGIDAVRRLKDDPARRHIPVWALTAHAMKGVREQAIEAGCAAYVTKPINADELATRLREFVRGQALRDVA